jgi:hypothetical protein
MVWTPRPFRSRVRIAISELSRYIRGYSPERRPPPPGSQSGWGQYAERQSPKTDPSLGRAISRNLARAFAFQRYGIHPSDSPWLGRDPCWNERLRGSSGHYTKPIRVPHAVLSAPRVQPLSRQRHRRRDLAYRGGTMVRRARRGVVRHTNDRLERHRKCGVVDVRSIGVIYPRGAAGA